MPCRRPAPAALLLPFLLAVVSAAGCLKAAVGGALSSTEQALKESLDACGDLLPRLIALLGSRPDDFTAAGCDSAAIHKLQHTKVIALCMATAAKLVRMHRPRAAYVLRAGAKALRRLASRGPVPDIQEAAEDLLSIVQELAGQRRA